MNAQNIKQAHEMTNKELFDELKERGFFLIKGILNGKDSDYGYVLVSNIDIKVDINLRYNADTDFKTATDFIPRKEFIL